MVAITRPSAIISAPNITVQRTPTRSAIHPIGIPPKAEPNHARAVASAGTERVPPTSPAMSLSATTPSQGAPNAVARTTTPTVATNHDDLESARRAAG